MKRPLVLAAAFVSSIGAVAFAQTGPTSPTASTSPSAQSSVDPPRPATPTSVPSCARGAVLVTVDGGTGSGTMIDARGYVLTNHHVVAPVLVPGFGTPSIRGGAHVRIQVPDGRTLEATEAYEAEIVGADELLDLAVLHVVGRPGEPRRDDLRFDAIPISDGDALPTATRVSVLGYPFGHRILTVLSGIITGRREQTDGEVDWLTIDAPFNPGNSGGSVVDDRCRLVGIPTQVYRGGLNPVNMARPVESRVRAYVASALDARRERPETTVAAAPSFGDVVPTSTAKPREESPRRRLRR